MLEPWISGSHAEVDPLLRPILHAFDHARADLVMWTADLTTAQIWARPFGLAAVGFHLRHIARSTERLFTYAQGMPLTEAQLAAASTEMDAGATRDELLADLDNIFERIARQVRELNPGALRETRVVGRLQLPATVAGLLVHIAEHTMRHVGEAIITAKVAKQAG